MRENRLYGSEGGGALLRSPYPYQGLTQADDLRAASRSVSTLQGVRAEEHAKAWTPNTWPGRASVPASPNI
jgi:hypothetical protein